MKLKSAVAVIAGLWSGVLSAQMAAPRSSNSNVIVTTEVRDNTAKDPTAAKRITRDQAVKEVKSGKAVFVDVRSFQQYTIGHLPGAISVPRSQLMTRLRELPPGKKLITYCACPVREHTSALAVLELNSHNVKNTAALQDGYLGWRKAGLPIETGPGSKTAANNRK
jgi:rhodanese-related sulfurtransferase